MGSPEVGSPPTSDNASASTLTYNWGPTSEMCFGEAPLDRDNLGGHDSPAEVE